MRALEFERVRSLKMSAGEVCSAIADVTKWADFEGYGPLPGIQSAEYVTRTPGMIGSIIRVSNQDGSSHSERILEWIEGERVVLQLDEFSWPLSLFAQRFVETWTFQTEADSSIARRRFELFARGPVGWLFLLGISRLLRAAVEQHMEQLAATNGRQ